MDNNLVPAASLLPVVRSDDRPTGIFSGTMFYFPSSHSLYEKVRFIVHMHGGEMVGLRELAHLSLVDPTSSRIPPGSVSIGFLKACVELGFYCDPEDFMLERMRLVFSYGRWRTRHHGRYCGQLYRRGFPREVQAV